MIELDILIPVYNEGEGILPVLKAIRDHVKTPCRVLICYDFEEDTTLPYLRTVEMGGIPIETIKNKSRGPHAAILTGFEKSQAPAVIFIPADDSENEPLVDRMMAEFKSGAALVCASRFMKGGRMDGCPLLKSILVRVANFTLYHGARIPTHDATNGFRLFSRLVLDTIAIQSSVGFTFSLELLVKTHRLGWRVAEIPAGWSERTKGQSRFRVLKWLPAYLRWYAYAFATTFLKRGPESVKTLEGRNHDHR